jgi:LmbE family N-acetylglucosaminyl deacetylase
MSTIFSRMLQIAGATALAVAFCYLAAPSTAEEFDETQVKQAVETVIAERTKDGAFVFHDPKLHADLNLVFIR